MVHELQPGDPQLVGPYQLRGRLGAGGMGQVFLGRSAGGRSVAVNVIHAHLATDPEFRERFRREIAVARKVSGLFTAPVIDADVDGPVPWAGHRLCRRPFAGGRGEPVRAAATRFGAGAHPAHHDRGDTRADSRSARAGPAEPTSAAPAVAAAGHSVDNRRAGGRVYHPATSPTV